MAENKHAVTTPCLAAAVMSPAPSTSKVGNTEARIQRNVAEKQRRDKLNGYISELANIVPMVSMSSKRLDKTSILRLSAAHLRICKRIGRGLTTHLIPQIIKHHFNKSFANAYGISLAGTCMFAMILASAMEFLLKKYGHSGALLITSGIMLHGIPIAMLLRNPKYSGVIAEVGEKNVSPDTGEFGNMHTNGQNAYFTRSVSQNSTNFESNLLEHSERKCVLKVLNDTTTTLFNKFENVKATDFVIKKVHKLPDQLLRQTESPSNHTTTMVIEVEKESHHDAESYSIEKDRSHNEKPYIREKGSDHERNQVNMEQDRTHNKKPKVLLKDSGHEEKPVSLIRELNRASSLVSPTCSQQFNTALKTLHVFTNPIFLLIMLSQSILFYIIAAIWTIIIDISRDKGIAESLEVYYLMLLPVAEILGNSSLGWVTDKGYLTNANYTGVCFAILGFSCAMFVWANSFIIMMFAALCFGFIMAGTGLAVPGLIYDFLPENEQSMAICSRFLLYAPLGYSMAPIIGYFRGTLGSYDGMLYLLASLSLACSGMTALIPFIATSRSSKKQNTCNKTLCHNTSLEKFDENVVT